MKRIFLCFCLLIIFYSNCRSQIAKDTLFKRSESLKVVSSGIYNNLYVNYYDNGFIYCKGILKEKKRFGRVSYYKDGLWIYYNVSGEIYEKVLYKNGRYIRKE